MSMVICTGHKKSAICTSQEIADFSLNGRFIAGALYALLRHKLNAFKIEGAARQELKLYGHFAPN